MIGYKPAMGQKPPFLDMPLDLLHTINDELHLAARIALSQTCRPIWSQMRGSCSSSFQTATAVERRECLVELGRILPDHYLCFRCYALHPADYEDLPTTGPNKCYPPCLSPKLTSTYYNTCYQYAFAFHHIQLALKYTHSKDSSHQLYRSRIMQAYEVSFPIFNSLELKFAAQPCIIRDRFMLKLEYVFGKGTEPCFFATVSETFLFFCPHHSLGGFRSHDRTIYSALHSAFYDKDKRVSGALFSCNGCPTDYKILVNDSTAAFTLWTNFGTGHSPEDPYWRSSILDGINDHSRYSKFDFEHGSVRRTWEDHESMVSGKD